MNETPTPTRREFTRQALQSLTALALIESLAGRRLFGQDVRPVIDAWFRELRAISKDVADHAVKDVEFQKALEALYARVDLPALLKTLDFDKMAAGVTYPALGAKSPARRLLPRLGLAQGPDLRPPDLRDGQGPLGRPARAR